MISITLKDEVLVWIHLRKEKFSLGPFTKLKLKTKGLFRPLNAMERMLVKFTFQETYLSTTCNAVDLLPIMNSKLLKTLKAGLLLLREHKKL